MTTGHDQSGSDEPRAFATGFPQPAEYQPALAYPPPSAYPVPAPPFPAPLVPVPAPVGGAHPRRWLAWPGILALLLVLALGGLVVIQAVQLDRLDDRLRAANERISQGQSADDKRLDGLEVRASALEQQAGKAFDSEAIATAVLPSVFRVRAGDFTGTAFAVGRPAATGGTNLFTNFHVVEQVYDGGGREVFLERRDERYPATIVKVDKANDVAHLRTSSKFPGLTTAGQPVKSGQPIVVVGAPLGLTDSVTTGVVSAFRKLEDGSGTVIQFDAPINPGNSGGPVINAEKQVVGIASAKARDAEGIGLAIPITTACDKFDIC